MNATAFLLAVKGREPASPMHPDPLEVARSFLRENASSDEAPALRRILRTLANGRGEYSEADAYVLGDKALALVAALFEARERCLYSEEEWQEAG